MPTDTMLPIFRKYGITVLGERLPVSEAYLIQLKNGSKPITQKFRRMAVAILNEPESELFGEAEG